MSNIINAEVKKEPMIALAKGVTEFNTGLNEWVERYGLGVDFAWHYPQESGGKANLKIVKVVAMVHEQDTAESISTLTKFMETPGKAEVTKVTETELDSEDNASH